MTILEAWNHYEKDKRYQGYSPYTLKAYKIQARLLAQEFDNCDINDITHQQLKDYVQNLVHLKASSKAHRVRFIKSLYSWAINEGHCRVNPAAKVKEPKLGQRKPKFMTEEDVEMLRAHCVTPLEHAIIEFMYTTGCRVGEIIKLNKKDIDWKEYAVIVDGKGGFEREIYFNTKCKIWLEKYLNTRTDKEEALFVTQRKFNGMPRRVSIDQMRWILKRVAKRAGLDSSVYPHRLRHSYATHMLNNGAPMEAIRQLLGHQKQESTEIYAHLSGQRKKEIYKRYVNN